MPEVSVVMPVYNGEKYLQLALDSLFSQDFTDFQIIAVDDGSTDNTAKILADNAKKDKRLKVVTVSPNKGLPNALNTGLENATGKYVARMDCDDISLPKRFSTQVKFLEAHPEIDLVAAFIEMFRDNEILGVHIVPTDPEVIKAAMLFTNPVAHPTVMIRKEFLDKHNLKYANQNVEDYEFWNRISNLGRIANIPEPLVKYRIHTSQFSSTHNVKQEAADLAIKQSITKRLGFEFSEDQWQLFRRIFTYGDVYNELGKVRQFKDILNAIWEGNLQNGWVKPAALQTYCAPFWFKQLRMNIPGGLGTLKLQWQNKMFRSYLSKESLSIYKQLVKQTCKNLLRRN